MSTIEPDDAPINYIGRTHAWYSALGYDNPYQYVRFDAVPFAPLHTALSACRVALLTTAAPYQPDRGDQGAGAPYNAAAKFFAVYSGDVSHDHDLRVSHVAVDRAHLSDDPSCWFPLPALRRAVASGRIGGLTARFHGVPTNRSQRHTLGVDAPEVLARCQADGTDAAVLVANCPVCHQTLSLVARSLEAAGIPTVVMGAALDIVTRYHQRHQFAAAEHDLLGVFVEQFEEAPFFGHQTAKHMTTPLSCATEQIRPARGA